VYVGLNCLKNLCLSLVSGVPHFLGLHPWTVTVTRGLRGSVDSTIARGGGQGHIADPSIIRDRS